MVIKLLWSHIHVDAFMHPVQVTESRHNRRLGVVNGRYRLSGWGFGVGSVRQREGVFTNNIRGN
jgi:hypothetical protein